MEAIALQTRHIVDSLNDRGHQITAIYMSGSQAMNRPMMQLFADCCSMPVVLPHSYSIAVVLGSAMLGRFAAESQGKQLDDKQVGEQLWKIMTEMTPPGTIVKPAAKPKEKKILEAKYKIFREIIDIQKRWRKEMAEASK
jgi:ribulose kinase